MTWQKDRQVRQQAEIVLMGGTSTAKTGRRNCNKKIKKGQRITL
jgi:hypothetical protein